ncbi:hypothetical protein [Bradyrhizobium sp. dw_411]|uniref:hypothetical protein n=1 Tax=Bradyrhizobium sp. dw_411 TaxID=2720082 RepID=UPI001BCE26A9|nr:hypothetical protein [Bradyrhizobium sp. dw_411]
MADEAFALSPISARAAQPREEDYDAIREAFMETSRGRWFLSEYAKRNRNADTRMVLDAVARIEETIAAQKKPAPDDNKLDEALAAIKASLVEARANATAALGDLGLEESLAPARKGARVIREIAWRLREIGADGRICDLIDSQVGAIEGACSKIAATDAMPALTTAFDLIEGRIKAFGDSQAGAPQPAEKEVPRPADKVVAFPQKAAEENAPVEAARPVARAAEEAIPPAPLPEAPAAIEAPAASTAADTETAMSSPALAAEPVAPIAEAMEAKAEFADPSSEAIDISADDADAEAAEAHDDAVLDMVAMEMAAFDPEDAYDPPESEIDEAPTSYETQASSEPELQISYEPQATALPPVTPLGVVAERPQPVIAAAPQPVQEPRPLPEPSLGSSLIASGLVRGHAASKPDPLAAIRRMSQAEKIALFS